jgi:hypothetical protein
VLLEDIAVRRGRNHIVHCASDQSQKFARAAQGNSAVSCFHELSRNGMISEGCKLAIGRSCKAIGEGETGTVGVNAPMTDGSGSDSASLLHYGDAFF